MQARGRPRAEAGWTSIIGSFPIGMDPEPMTGAHEGSIGVF